MAQEPRTVRRIQDVDVRGKAVVVRADYNVPMEGETIQDDGRIRASLPTLSNLLDRGALVVVMTHLGRPDGAVVESLRLDPIARRLQELLGRPVRKLDDCVGPAITKAIRGGKPGDVFVVENLRFHAEEEENDPAFSAALAELGDLYVDDAFGTLHRAHASTVGIAERRPAYAGLLVQKEIDVLSRVLYSPVRPYVAIVGGKKASDKLGALRDLVSRVDCILVGGGVAFTFLAASGAIVGDSVVDSSLFEDIRGIVRKAGERGTEIVLPKDVVAAGSLSSDAETRVVPADSIPAGWKGFDIGPETVRLFAERIARAKTVVWAGPMGAFEFAPFAAGTRGVAEAVAASSSFSVIGGGETGEAVAQFGFGNRVSFVSTGGGACLAYLRGKSLPALDVLTA
ncbi:MAG: phosphoglycerate kinase [Candidatus Bipolaricaulis sp.]|nr:phosphoglycerate kinase [Candidatus Bipolaricaulis sp.]